MSETDATQTIVSAKQIKLGIDVHAKSYRVEKSVKNPAAIRQDLGETQLGYLVTRDVRRV